MNWLAAAAVVVAVVWGGGCRPPPAASQPVGADVEVVLDSPVNAAGTVLAVLRAHLDAVARGDAAGAARMRDLAIERVAAADEIRARFRRALGGRPFDADAMLRTHVESWAAMIACYDQFEWGAATTELGSDPMRAEVRVPVRGRDDAAVLRLVCRGDASGVWRVGQIGFVRGLEGRAAATQTAPAGLP